MVDAARLADELRAEQDHATSMGTAKNSLGNQLGELEGRLADAENAAMKGGKAAMAKMEGKIRELEAELASTQSRTGEAAKALQRAERKSKELAFAQGEDRKNQDRMSELAAKLQGKIKTYKQQIEKIGRTRTVCLNLLQSSKGRSKPTNSMLTMVTPTRPTPILTPTSTAVTMDIQHMGTDMD